MCFYSKAGLIPKVKHTTFYKEDGKSIYREELFSSKGFSGAYTTKYHYYMPPAMTKLQEINFPRIEVWEKSSFNPYHFRTDKIESAGNFIDSRCTVLENENTLISIAKPTEDSELFYKNASAWEYLFVHHGVGELVCDLGRLKLKPGDHVIIPKNMIYHLKFKNYNEVKLFIVESKKPLEFPKHYINSMGQLLEHAPFCERDIQIPEFCEPVIKKQKNKVVIKRGKTWYEQSIPHHPFDVVGWDGYLFPFTLNIHDFNPVVGRIHLPPPVHALFQNDDMVICNFVPRLFDFHSNAVPAPYFHSNIDSDEVLYYIKGNFMSRKGIEEGSITLHPSGLIHGPQPGKTEDSVGKKSTDELAVMVDTFEPLKPTLHVQKTMDPEYGKSWLE